MPSLRPDLHQADPLSGPRLAHQTHDLLVGLAGIRGAHLEQPDCAELAYIHCTRQHALAQGAGRGGLLGGLGGQFVGLHHQGFFQVLSTFLRGEISDFGGDF